MSKISVELDNKKVEEFEKLAELLKNKSFEDLDYNRVLSVEVLKYIEEKDIEKLCESFITDKININDLFVDNDYVYENFKYGIYLIKACAKYDSRDVLDFLIQTMGKNNDYTREVEKIEEVVE